MQILEKDVDNYANISSRCKFLYFVPNLLTNSGLFEITLLIFLAIVIQW